MITPEMPTRWSGGQAIFRHHPHSHIDPPVGVVSARWSQIRQINVEVLFASVTVMRRVGHQEINWVTSAHITQIMQRALSRFVPRGEMRAPGTRSLLLVAMIRHELGGGEIVDVGHPLGGVWHVSARSVHDGLPEEKGWERQYKSDRLACPDRIQNRCYSVQSTTKMYSPKIPHDLFLNLSFIIPEGQSNALKIAFIRSCAKSRHILPSCSYSSFAFR